MEEQEKTLTNEHNETELAEGVTETGLILEEDHLPSTEVASLEPMVIDEEV